MKLMTLQWKGATAAARVDGERATVLERFADVGDVLRAGPTSAVAGIDGPVRNGLTTSFEVGLGGGARVGLILRQAVAERR